MRKERPPVWGPFLLRPMQDYKQAKLIFVIGRPKSGTNLLRSILNLHSLVWISGEPGLWIKGKGDGVVDLTAELLPFDDAKKIDRLFGILGSGMVNGNFWTFKKLDLDKLRRDFEKTDRQYRDLLWLALSQRGKANKKSIFGEKTPHNLYHLKELTAWYPGAKFVHVIRDPRAVFVSEIHRRDDPHHRLKKPHPLRTPGIFLYVLWDWNRNVRYHKKYLRKYPGRYIMVKFSDLNKSMQETVEHLSAFLGIKFEQTMLHPPKRGSSFEEGYDPVNGWRKKIPWLYKFLFDLILGRKIRKYACHTPFPGR